MGGCWAGRTAHLSDPAYGAIAEQLTALPCGPNSKRERKGSQKQVPKKIRVYELARELGLTNKEALDLCIALGIGVKSHSSSIEDAQADRVRRKADAEGLRREVAPPEPEAKAPVEPRRAREPGSRSRAATSTEPDANP